jgi:hypothetical protein
MWSTIIAAILAATATGISTGVQAGAARKAGEMEELAVGRANKQAREDWREEMEIKEEERRKKDLRTSIQSFQNTLNGSRFLKQQMRSLWAGRG